MVSRISPNLMYLAEVCGMVTCHHSDFDVSVGGCGDMDYANYSIFTSYKKTNTYKKWKQDKSCRVGLGLTMYLTSSTIIQGWSDEMKQKAVEMFKEKFSKECDENH